MPPILILTSTPAAACKKGGASQILDGQLPVNGSDRLVSLNFRGEPARSEWPHQRRQPTHYG